MTLPNNFQNLLAEGVDLEFKAAQGQTGSGKLPESFWETYSSMANTKGGKIILGVAELSFKSYEIKGLTKAESVKTALWNQVNQRQTINVNLLKDSDVSIEEHEGKHILVVNVPRAKRTQRPVYKGLNPLTGTYRRDDEGDYRCDEDSIKRMMAEASSEPRDSLILPNYGIEDINKETVEAYRNRMGATQNNHAFLAFDGVEFLRQLGAWKKDRDDGSEGLTIAGLLMFGRYRSILDALPYYHVDYQEHSYSIEERRWEDRITNDGSWSGNLFDFYYLVYPKLIKTLKVPFHLENASQRIDETSVHEAIREAFVNSLVHADYYSYSGNMGIRILKKPDIFEFQNAGMPRLPIPNILAGGESDIRNTTLQKMFNLIGLSDRAGSGFPKINRAWKAQHWRGPLLQEVIKPEKTILRLTMLSLFPQEEIDKLTKRFGEKFDQLKETERLAVVTAAIDGSVNNSHLCSISKEHARDLTTMFSKLVKDGFLVPDGRGRGTSYRMSDNTIIDEHQIIFDDLYSKLSYLGQDIETLIEIAQPVRNKSKSSPEELEKVILEICKGRFLKAKDIAIIVQRLRVKNSLQRLVNANKLELQYKDNKKHENQAYRTVE
jgi:ATP-dependent DNA helicase RecG